MKPKDFEQGVLELAMTTRVPLTRANILFYTGVSSKQAEKWIDGLIGDGLLDMDSDDDGEVIYTVRGTRRPATGPQELRRCTACGKATVTGSRCARCGQSMDARTRALHHESDREARSAAAIDRASSALALLRRQSDLLGPQGEGDKSVLVGGLLGLVGPLGGWLYAAPLREAGPAVAVTLLLMMILPQIILTPLLFLLLPILMPTSALVGALYAWKYNRAGHRSGLVTEDDAAQRGGG